MCGLGLWLGLDAPDLGKNLNSYSDFSTPEGQRKICERDLTFLTRGRNFKTRRQFFKYALCIGTVIIFIQYYSKLCKAISRRKKSLTISVFKWFESPKKIRFPSFTIGSLFIIFFFSNQFQEKNQLFTKIC
jgi:hypothetical protein